jgi:flagellar FlgN protein
MTAQPATTALGAAVLGHLQAQIESARRLLECILRQGAAVRAREVDGVLAAMTEIQAEMGARTRMESDRARLLAYAGAALGLEPAGVTLEAMTQLMSAAEAEVARVRSAELRGLLAEIAREHGVNRALMRQELTFLGHLTRLIGAEPQTGYRPPSNGPAAAPQPAAPHRVLNVQA